MPILKVYRSKNLIFNFILLILIMNKLLLYLIFCFSYFISNAKTDSLSIENKNTFSFSYAPSFTTVNEAKDVFHGIEFSYERLIISRLSISFTQGFYTTTPKNTIWIDSDINVFKAKRRDYYLNSYLTINAVAFYNKMYSLKIGIGPTLSYRNTLAIKSNESSFSYNEHFFDKGVFGGLHVNLQNDFTIKQHLLIGLKFQSHIIFPKKNIGDKQFILRPSIAFGYKF